MQHLRIVGVCTCNVNKSIQLRQIFATFKLVVASVSNNNALSFYDKSSSKFQLVVASVANECSKGSSMKTAQRAICSKCKSFQSRGHCYDKNQSELETTQLRARQSKLVQPRGRQSKLTLLRARQSDLAQNSRGRQSKLTLL